MGKNLQEVFGEKPMGFSPLDGGMVAKDPFRSEGRWIGEFAICGVLCM